MGASGCLNSRLSKKVDVVNTMDTELVRVGSDIHNRLMALRRGGESVDSVLRRILEMDSTESKALDELKTSLEEKARQRALDAGRVLWTEARNKQSKG